MEQRSPRLGTQDLSDRLRLGILYGLATTGCVLNLGVMGLSYWLADENTFLIAWAGASFAAYAILVLKEEARDVAAQQWGYKSIAMRLRWEIAQDDRYKPGSRLPTQAEYAARLGTSRTTVRKALALLQDEGLVQAIQGRGIYVVGSGGFAGQRDDYPRDRVERDLLALIDKADVGTLMPSAAELVHKHRVSATTVRRVQTHLAAQGLIRATRNGTYVKA